MKVKVRCSKFAVSERYNIFDTQLTDTSCENAIATFVLSGPHYSRERSGTRRNCDHIILWNGTDTFFAGENITAGSSNS